MNQSNFTADEFFIAEQQQRLAELMERWHSARDESQPLPEDEQAELRTLIEAELHASGERTRAHFSNTAATNVNE